MRLIQTHLTELMIEVINDNNLLGLLKYLNSDIKNTAGTPSGQHWLRALRICKPLNSSSPCFFTIAAAQGFRIGFV